MYITSVIVEGFKSYGRRTVIDGFDREFNAITGLNGTGKSNILDAICFVLGISNLSQIRAGSLQDLIYKSGQAGINQATVTIEFDNTNPEQSPSGFEDVRKIVVTRQINMGGKTKYLLNGSKVQNKKVQDLFCSVQLNVNNPHFLIMQGRITKVLNMKPVEILAMIEEAAGVKLYETKRLNAIKTIEKKDAKLEEIDKIIGEDINPKIEKFREQRVLFIELQDAEREIVHLTSIVHAWIYISAKNNIERIQKAADEGKNKKDENLNKIKQYKDTIKEIDVSIEEMSKQCEQDSSGKLQELEKEVKDMEKKEAEKNSLIKTTSDSIAAQKKQITQLQKNFKEDQVQLEKKENHLGKAEGEFTKLKDAEAADNEALSTCQRKFQALSAGMEINEAGEQVTLQETLITAKRELSEAINKLEEAEMLLPNLQKQLKTKQNSVAEFKQEHEKEKVNLQTFQTKYNDMHKKVEKIDFSPKDMETTINMRNTLRKDIAMLSEKTDNFYARLPVVNFNYRDPCSNFDKSSVKGVVCRLIKVRNPIYYRSLETAGGGKLYNVIVDTSETSKLILKKGNLKYRTTFIPLNKIRSNRISDKVLKHAQALVGKENVMTALSLIDYDKSLEAAMEFVFGDSFVCSDLHSARTVAFADGIKRRCITLDGDIVDPAGVLSGGAVSAEEPKLLQLENVKKYEEEIKTKQQQLSTIEKNYQKLLVNEEEFRQWQNKLDMAKHELDLAEKRLQQTAYHFQYAEIQQLQETIDKTKEKSEENKNVRDRLKATVRDLEKRLNGSSNSREQELKEMELEMKRLQKKADNSSKEWKKREQEYELLTLEIEELKKGQNSTQQQIQSVENNLVELEKQKDELKELANEAKNNLSAARERYKFEKSTITAKNKEIQTKVNKKDELSRQINEVELEMKKHEFEINKMADDLKAAKARETEAKKKLKNEDRSIETAQRMSEGQAADVEKRLRTANEKKTKLSRVVNYKVQSSLEQVEKEYNELIRKRKVVQHDRKKILRFIDQMDKRKEQLLQVAWKQIGKDFGSIFGTLLTGGGAKLVATDSKDINKGLEIKVRLGDVWKDSLGELSGGQRSLVALSLVLAMLLFKPAPLYILDEVDAALDLSHTQNIGHMLKMHFKQSQFIIVSLKDGMFDNANVLFRTQFVDGMSAVGRTVNKKK